MNKYKVVGILNDIVTKDGIDILKDGKRQHGAIGWYRIVNPLKKLGAEIVYGMILRNSPENAFWLKEKGDIWFSKVSDNEGIDHIFSTHRDFTGSKFVLDLDDYPGSVNEDHPDYQTLEKKKEMRVRMLKIADHVVVATEKIKDAVEDINPYVTVIPNTIDPSIWNFKNKKRKDGMIRIGWMSSGSHFADLPIIQPVMEEIMDKYPNVEFHFAGMTWESHHEDRFHHHVGRSGYMDFPKWYASLGIDISIAPLKDTQFNICKSNIKWMEAAMLEIPTVASDVEPYRCIKHAKNGFLANSKEQWVKYLSLLIENPALRQKIGKEAKATVMNEWTVDKYLHKYEELFDELNDKKDITVVTAITGEKDHLASQPRYKGVDYVAFVEPGVKDSFWKTRPVCNKFVKPVMNAKIHKVLTHKYVDTPYIVWIDGNVSLKQDPRNLIKLMGDKDFAFFKHPTRDDVYDEAEACIGMGKGNRQEIAEQVKSYARDGVEPHTGLYELPCFIRKNTPKANKAFERWWLEITRYSNRDQISFPVAFKGEKFAIIPGTVDDARNYKELKKYTKEFPGNEYFLRVNHKHYNHQQ